MRNCRLCHHNGTLLVFLSSILWILLPFPLIVPANGLEQAQAQDAAAPIKASINPGGYSGYTKEHLAKAVKNNNLNPIIQLDSRTFDKEVNNEKLMLVEF